MSRFNTLNSRSRLRCIAFIASAEKFFPVLFCLPVKVKQNEIFYFAPLSPIRKDEKN